ncbi:MAG: phosphoenolpyruvate--protein phosphotransferase [Planctomycetaceae bacterium]|nr:phosphoenolpyruvate--protein phosphotransferase [Planctomycetaceae bacterium]
MLVRRGIAVSPGVAIAKALVLGTETFRIPHQFVRPEAVESEVGRFRSAHAAVCEEIRSNEQLAADHLGKQYGAIFGAHLQLLMDPKLTSEIEQLIRDKFYAPEFAASRVLRKYAKVVQSLGGQYMAERATDLFDLEKRVLRQMLGQRREELANLTCPVIVIARNLTPSETASLDRKHVLGFATEGGGRTSHTAILAGALEIPAVVGLGRFLSDVSTGETLIIDGNVGEVIISPDEATLERYRDQEAKRRTIEERLLTFANVTAETKDGVRVYVMGNIEFPDEVEHCTSRGADGIGLYRTEFLYLQSDREPTEEVHYQAYCRVIDACGGKPVVIRTLDLGADKIPGSFREQFKDQPNSALGLRSIRLSLQNLPLFRTQLRAILRAATRGDVRIMFPLVSTLLEFRQAKMILSDVMEDLQDEGIEFKRDVPVGMMVEVPAAAMLAEEFSREVDFFSIGTNDLIQYTLAVDRADTSVATLYSSGDPSILRLIKLVVEAGRKRGLPVTVCGQMSSDPKFLAVLVGLGMRQISVTPHALPELKALLHHMTIPQAEEIARRAMSFDLARDVENYLRGELKKLSPEATL